MATKAFQKIYTKITQITKATCSLKATGVGYDELASVDGKLAQVVKIIGDEVTLQVFSGTEGIRTNAEVVFMGKAPSLKVGDQLAGRFFNAYGEPIDGGPIPEGREVEIGGPSVNPVRRKQPSELIATGIAGIDLNNTLVTGQKIPFFADPDQPFNQVMAMVALRAKSDKIILGGMGMTNDDYLFFKNTFSNAGALDRIVSFINTTEDPSVERILVPDMALSAAEYFAVEKNEKVLVLLTDMTNYADALAIVSNRMDQIPSKDSMPGSLYSDLAKIYEKAVQFPAGGSITIIAVTTLSGGDITHAVPDNTGYITEGQLYLRRDSDVGKVIVDPFRSLSRLKQLVTGKKTREDHPQVMNAAVRLYADAANAKTKLENGFDLTDYDNRTLSFAKDYSSKLLAIDVNLDTTEMLDVAWGLFARYFSPEEVNIKQGLVDFSAPDLEGNMVKLSDQIKGKVALIDLWASWCGPCRRLSSSMIPIYEAFKDKGFTVVGIARENNNTDAMKKAIEQDKYPWLNLVELNDKGNIWEMYGAGNSGGCTYLVDKDGKILAIHPSAEEVTKILTEMLP